MSEKYTIETYRKAHNLTRQSAINKLSRLKKKGLVQTSGGGPQKRIYTVSNIPEPQENGFYSIINKYSPEKLRPKFKHIIKGRYTIEHSIIDGIIIGDSRTIEATQHLFFHVKNFKRLFEIADRRGVRRKVLQLYHNARKKMKTRRMPKRYDT